MSKKTNENVYEDDSENTFIDGQKDDAHNAAADKKDTPLFCVVDEHAKSLKVPAHVFAAVRQSKGWEAGKKVSETEFKEAVNTFLGAPIGGKK